MPGSTTPAQGASGWNELAAQLTGLAHLATASAEGRPHVSVVAPVLDGDRLWIFTRRGSGKARNLAVNPAVALMWRPGAEIYLQGRAELVDDPADKAKLWARSDLPFDPAAFFGSPDHPDLVLVRVVPERAVILGPGGRRVWTAPN